MQISLRLWVKKLLIPVYPGNADIIIDSREGAEFAEKVMKIFSI